MNKRNLLTSLILITAVLTSTVKAFGYAQVRQRLLTIAEPAVAIEKLTENNAGNIAVETGIHSGLGASFQLQTNDDDSGYDYILTATTPTTGGSTSAFTKINDQTGIVFVNVSAEPTLDDIDNAKNGSGLNRNVIVYPISMEIDNPMTVEYVPNHATYDNCWQVRVNGGTSGVLTQTINGTPLAGTYTIGHDAAGSYQATIVFTAYSK